MEPTFLRHGPPDDQCLLPRLLRSDHLIMRRVGSFLGAEAEQPLQDVREFAEVREKEMAVAMT